MARQEDLDRACAETDERRQRRAAARERMVAQIGEGRPLPGQDRNSKSIFVIRTIPECPWCREPFDAATWEMEPSLRGQFPSMEAVFGDISPVGMGDHEATCPACGFTAHFQPKKEC